MAKFRIDFNLSEKYGGLNLLRLYPNIPEGEILRLGVETFSEISIEIENRIVIPSWIKPEEKCNFTATEYLWDFFVSLIKKVRKIDDEKEHTVSFTDDPLFLTFEKKGDNVIIRFENSNERLGNTVVETQEFIEEVLKVVNKFIKVLFNLNPLLERCTEIRDLIKLKNEVEKIRVRNI